MDTRSLLNWIELSPSALDTNLDSLSRLASGRVMAVSVKSNAYGHGLPQMIDMLQDRDDVSYVSVHSLDEAICCRKYGWSKNILLLGPAPLTEMDAILEYDLEPVVFTSQALTLLGKLATKHDRPIRTHIKLETGTNRQGITAKDLDRFAAIYKKYPRMGKPCGASMHFANIEDTTNHEYAQEQLDRFKALTKRMGQLGIKPKVRHTACSAALILFEKTRFEMVRPGCSVYGHWPSKETYLSYRLSGGENNIFRPVLSWHTRVTQIKKVPRDSFVGYGCTYRTTTATRLAVLPVGYADGYSRSLSSIAYVLIKGRRAPVRGRVCMNLMMVDITDIPGVRLEEPVTLIGSQAGETLSADQIAAWGGTICYEVLARLSPDISRLIADK